MAPGVAFALSLILVVGLLQEGPGSLAKTFTFPEYPYKETTKNVSRRVHRVRRCEWCRAPRPIQVMAEQPPFVRDADTFTTPGTGVRR